MPWYVMVDPQDAGAKLIPLILQVVSLTSADIPPTTSGLVQGKVANLEGLNHTQVTGYSTMEDSNLQIILSSFLEMQQTERRLGRPPGPAFGAGGPPIPRGSAGGGIPPPPGDVRAVPSPFPRGQPGLPRGGGIPPQRGRGVSIMPPPNQLRGMASGLQQGGQPAAQF